jgi:hypothetical protein
MDQTDHRPPPQDQSPSTNTSGTQLAGQGRMKAKNIEEVVVYNEAVAAGDEVSAILERPIFGRDLNTKGQLDRSSSRIAPLMLRALAS